MMEEKREIVEKYDDQSKKPFRRIIKKKICVFCQEKVGFIDYKEDKKLRKLVTEKGRIIPRRTTGTCAKHQRELAVAIKNARIMALLPFKAE